jgi:hypothetical protein
MEAIASAEKENRPRGKTVGEKPEPRWKRREGGIRWVVR